MESIQKLTLTMIDQCGKHRFRGNIGKGPETSFRKTSAKKSGKIGKPRQTLKNTNLFIFFQNFKHIKQLQHQINTLARKYGENTHIYNVVDAK